MLLKYHWRFSTCHHQSPSIKKNRSLQAFRDILSYLICYCQLHGKLYKSRHLLEFVVTIVRSNVVAAHAQACEPPPLPSSSLPPRSTPHHSLECRNCTSLHLIIDAYHLVLFVDYFVLKRQNCISHFMVCCNSQTKICRWPKLVMDI